MDFDEAIRSHSKWKSKLKLYLSEPDRSLDPSTVSKDNQCELGKWLHGEGLQYGRLAQYKNLVANHAAFHVAAAAVIEKADRGQSVESEVVLGSTSAFSMASMAVVQSLMAMKASV